MSQSLITLEKNVYDAINMYKNNGYHKLLKINYEKIYNDYIKAGGKRTLKSFEDTIDSYNIQGVCGY